MDNNQQFTPYNRTEIQSFRALRRATLFFFIALGTMMLGTLVFPYIFGTISIIFAYLAKARNPKHTNFGRMLIILSVVIIVLNTIYAVYMIHSIVSNPEFIRQLNEISQGTTQTSFEEYYNSLTNPATVPEGGWPQ